jgi:hypothetical protein
MASRRVDSSLDSRAGRRRSKAPSKDAGGDPLARRRPRAMHHAVHAPGEGRPRSPGARGAAGSLVGGNWCPGYLARGQGTLLLHWERVVRLQA